MPFDQTTPATITEPPTNVIYIERRKGLSETQQAQEILHHAVEYLIEERDNDQQLFVHANRQAIALLCKAAQQVTHGDRREATRRYAMSWIWDALRGAQ